MEEKEIIEEENKPSEKKPADGNFMKIILLLAMVFVVMYMVFGKGRTMMRALLFHNRHLDNHKSRSGSIWKINCRQKELRDLI